MSGLDGLQLDGDGYLDMDQFPDDGTDIAGADLAELREVLHSDPVEEPTAEQWDAMFDDVVAVEDAGPFALDDVDGLVPEAESVSADDPFAVDDGDGVDGGDGVDATDAGEDGDVALANDPDDLDLDGVTPDELDVDLAPDLDLDLAPDDTIDDVYTPEVLDDGPADISHDFEDLL
ncbi:MAG TPA: hypothetical protein VK507_08015 [Iamia sp.]|nr:hypothetical protein [Iamia sp.]